MTSYLSLRAHISFKTDLDLTLISFKVKDSHIRPWHSEPDFRTTHNIAFVPKPYCKASLEKPLHQHISHMPFWVEKCPNHTPKKAFYSKQMSFSDWKPSLVYCSYITQLQNPTESTKSNSTQIGSITIYYCFIMDLILLRMLNDKYA